MGILNKVNTFKLIEETKDKKIELNKEYYVIEWSWNPISDVEFVCKEKIRYSEKVNGYTLYFTGDNYRAYLPWQIFETKQEAEDFNKSNDYADIRESENIINNFCGNSMHLAKKYIQLRKYGTKEQYGFWREVD